MPRDLCHVKVVILHSPEADGTIVFKTAPFHRGLQSRHRDDYRVAGKLSEYGF